MKKIFLSFLAIIAMVGMVSAQRTWAYGLNMTQEGDNYTFVFKSTTAATAANLVFTDAAGEVAGKVALEDVVAGENTKVLALADIPGEGTLNWAVELTGAAIAEVTKLTDDSKYGGFWFAYGVGVNNNPESEYFGNIYVSNPRHKDAPEQTGFYKYSPELVLDETIFVNGEKRGYKPSNVDIAALNAVDAIQRMAVSPVDGTVAFVQWNSAPFAAYGMNPANLAGDAVNLTEGINQPVALCYDHEGSLCVLSYDGKSEGVSVYGIHIIKNGEKTTFFSQAGWVAGGYCEIASDGQGGFYVMSGVLNASNVVTTAKLQHISKNAEIDLTVLPGGAELAEAPATFNRLRLAYDLKHDVLAIGGGKKVNLYNATYAAETGAPTLTKWTATSELTTNIDGIAFDYAGDLYVVSAGTETFYKFALPTENNTCMTPAKKAQVIVKEAPAPVKYTVTLENNIEQDSVYLEGVGMVGVTSGAGEYEAGTEVEIRAHQLGEYYFIGWADENGEIITQDLRYVFTITEDVTYTATYAALLSVTSTDLDLSTPDHLKGTDPTFQMGTLTIDLVLGELDEEEGTYEIVPETSVLSAGEVKFQIEEGVAVVDAEENAAIAMVFVTFEGQLFVFYIEMSAAAAAAEVIDVTVENATVNITEYETGFGGGKATELVVSADWVYEADGLTYNVMVVIAEFDPTAASGEYTASFFVQGEGDAIGMTEEAEVTVAIEGGKVVVTGEGIQAYNGNVYNLTISGTMPVEDEPATSVDNLNTTVAPVKMIENGQLIVIKDGVKFNAAGAVVK